MRTIVEAFGLRSIPADLEVGVEIEMEGSSLVIESVPKGWTATNDGSLRGNAVEYVLSKPVPRKEPLKEKLDSLQQTLKAYGSTLRPSDRCGVHVHINCQTMTERQVVNFALLYFIIEEVLIKFCDPSREDNLFCLRAKDAVGLIEALYRAQRSGRLDILTNDKYRYASLNFASLAKYGSIEFRSLETPKDFKKIYDWAELLLRVRDASLEYLEAVHILESVSGMGGASFFHHVMGPHASLFEKEDLNTLVMDGVRLVQHIIYTSWPERKKVKTTRDMAELLRGMGVDPEAQARHQEPQAEGLGIQAGGRWDNVAPIRWEAIPVANPFEAALRLNAVADDGVDHDEEEDDFLHVDDDDDDDDINDIFEEEEEWR